MTKPTTIKDYIQESHAIAVSKGWWEGERFKIPCHCLMKGSFGYTTNPLCETCNGIGFKLKEIERSFGAQIALMHSELSEALEEFRNTGLGDTDKFIYYLSGSWGVDGEKPEGIAVELADVLIRIFDTCGKYNIPLQEALDLKLAYNKTRPHRHGGKKL
jgi:NTP pyrophosphatase (non-canonical NTP hydrolase)